MSVLLEFAMFPTSAECREGSSVSHKVAKIIDMIDQSALNYQLTPMGTIVECESVKEALGIVERAYEQLEECERVYSTIKLDIRKGKLERLDGKIASIESKLGRNVKH
ncbi:thiamine-binding protein [Sulfuricurvum sp.]|uniref:thiamine-binding protein n=1 Tax=Sulfuricurvum sp. TaxID=2025608 RepID=UPI002625F6D3|nr:thiamine-binding protein [Sulfuricurvum sp.]MDD2838988.1 thiamine-binding protein [Sulfuricurvum sp.]MDD3596264.1 thiamine-binding protein [Sulfuricurvum sp.]